MDHAGQQAHQSTLAALRRFGSDAVSFQGLESGFASWIDQPTGAVIRYIESGGSWIAAGSPLIEPSRRAEVARRFAAAAAARRRRAVFVGVESLDPFDGFHRLQIGLQSELKPAEWPQTLKRNSRLREQVRRARAKGVTIRRVSAADLHDGTPLRAAVERLGSEWLSSRHMEPMEFLVAVEPFHAADEHIYLVAERNGTPIEFLSAVPIYARSGWLMEDVLRSRAAPNGTTELTIDFLMRELGGDPHWLTPGLTPLAGPVPRWLRWTRVLTAALYDFDGLRRFRSRLHPWRWSPVWLVWDRGVALLPLFDVLRAFAGGRLAAFAVRSLINHPNGPPFAVAVPLVGWIPVLAWLAATGRTTVLGFSTAALWGWVVFDTILAALMFRAARKPHPSMLAALTTAVAFDAIASWRHWLVAGPGAGWFAPLMRMAATLGPTVGVAALAWATHRARVTISARRAGAPAS